MTDGFRSSCSPIFPPDTNEPWRSAFFYRWLHVRPRPRLNLRQIPDAAVDLHNKVYTQLAKGNLEPVQNFVVPGFLGSLRARIAQRQSGTSLRWVLHEHKTQPKLASFRVAMFPPGTGETNKQRKGAIQAVVRLHTLQSLQHVRLRPTRKGQAPEEVLVDAQGKELPLSEQTEAEARKNAKELVEYIVLQKLIRNSREGAWKVWGTTDETTLDKVKQLEAKANQSALPLPRVRQGWRFLDYLGISRLWNRIRARRKVSKEEAV